MSGDQWWMVAVVFPKGHFFVLTLAISSTLSAFSSRGLDSPKKSRFGIKPQSEFFARFAGEKKVVWLGDLAIFEA